MGDLLFLSNGHGEDAIAGQLIDALRRISPFFAGESIEAWPMVGEGEAYRIRGVPIAGPKNILPSAGFATIDWRLMWRDLRAGWIGTHWRQMRAARAMRGQARFAVAVGDIIPIAAAVLARVPFLFVGCAKSSYYNANPFHGYTWLEKRLLRRHCLMAFPRDRLTAAELRRAGVPCEYAGNPMMDGLEGHGETFGLEEETTAILMLPGSRGDAEANAAELLAAAAALAGRPDSPRPLAFLIATALGFDVEALLAALERRSEWLPAEPAGSGDESKGVVWLRHGSGAMAAIAQGRFADAARRGVLAVGMAGTANEQAVGLGLPLIMAPSAGVQGANYVRMKSKYFGEAAWAVERRPEAIAAAVAALLADPARRERMSRAGRERMGDPGASAAIAGEIVRRWRAAGASGTPEALAV